jgi:hypothetical protein
MGYTPIVVAAGFLAASSLDRSGTILPQWRSFELHGGPRTRLRAFQRSAWELPLS